MKNNSMNKIIAIGIFALMLSLTAIPQLNAANNQQNLKKPIKPIYSKNEIDRQDQKIQPLTINHNIFQQDIENIMSNLNTKNFDFDNLEELLNWLLNKSNYPILSAFFSQMLKIDRFKGRDIIISYGWNYNLNPLKQPETEIVQLIDLWGYRESSKMMGISSTTILISSDPFNMDIVTGRQLGFIFRFRGISGCIPQQYPELSFTYRIGTVKHAAALDLPATTMALDIF